MFWCVPSVKPLIPKSSFQRWPSNSIQVMTGLASGRWGRSLGLPRRPAVGWRSWARAGGAVVAAEGRTGVKGCMVNGFSLVLSVAEDGSLNA
jgi:hypothetical protein